jgi:hypothetical protein
VALPYYKDAPRRVESGTLEKKILAIFSEKRIEFETGIILNAF